MLDPTREENVLDIVLSSQQELVDNVRTGEPLEVAIITRYYLPSMCNEKEIVKDSIEETSTKDNIKI